jgi:hypothetical protein
MNKPYCYKQLLISYLRERKHSIIISFAFVLIFTIVFKLYYIPVGKDMRIEANL